jgi:gliding motility-associated GldM-like protein
MKACQAIKFLLTFFFFCIQLKVVCQPKLLNLTSTLSSDAYIGIDNQFVIKGVHDLKPYSLTSSHGIVIANDSFYSVRFVAEQMDTLRLYRGKKLIGKTVLQIHHIPDPIARLPHNPDTVATVFQVLANPYIEIYFPDCNVINRQQVTSYFTTFLNSRLDTIASPMPSEGRFMTKDQKDVIKKLKPGDKIVFSDIRFTGSDDRMRMLLNLIVLIK